MIVIESEQVSVYLWKMRFDAHMRGIELMSKAFWPESYNKEDWK